MISFVANGLHEPHELLVSFVSFDDFLLSSNDTNCTNFFFLSPDEPDEPDGWRNDYLVNPVCLVIKFKKGQALSQRLPLKKTTE